MVDGDDSPGPPKYHWGNHGGGWVIRACEELPGAGVRRASQKSRLAREQVEGGGERRFMKALSLFSGIGGLDLAAHSVGIETVAFCEIEPYAVQVLNKRFPGVTVFDDVRKVTKEVVNQVIKGNDKNNTPKEYEEVVPDGSYVPTIDVVHGGFPQ